MLVNQGTRRKTLQARREPTTNSKSGHIGGRRALLPPNDPCSNKLNFVSQWINSVNYILPPKHDQNNQDDDHHSHNNTNYNPLPIIAAWLNWSRCWWRWWRGRRGKFEENFYIKDVCTNSCLKVGLVSYNDLRESTARQDRDVSDEESKRLLHVKRYLEGAWCVLRVTRQ